MSETDDKRPHLKDNLKQVIELLRAQGIAEKLAVLADALHPEGADSAPLPPALVDLEQQLNALHPADVAHILEMLPVADRLLIWELVRQDRDGEILLEVSDAVRESLIENMDVEELVAAAEQLDADELADLAPDLPPEVLDGVFATLSMEEREQLRAAMSYPEDSVGALMDFEMIDVREDVSVEVVLRYLRRREELPDHTDQLFVVDRDEHLRGLLPVNRLLVSAPGALIGTLMVTDGIVTLRPEQDAQEAALSFERYDLVSAAVVDADGKLVARVTINAVVDFIRERSENEMLSAGGLSEDEDLFAPVWRSLKNRWTWLALNLVTAFIASRVIGIFEHSIEKLVALAALMPIIAGIGGNTGNQTITMIVRGLALGQITTGNARKLLTKEFVVAVVNGLVWGTVVGLFAFLIYSSWQLGAVMMGAMLLNLMLAALMGFAIPMTMHRLGRDPALGASVMITAITDSGGFFIFLGLATLFLV